MQEREGGREVGFVTHQEAARIVMACHCVERGALGCDIFLNVRRPTPHTTHENSIMIEERMKAATHY
jgi:hypothetical protein